MPDKQVLISYLDSNKVVRIPQSISGDQLPYLTQQFKKAFLFGENVKLLVTFQKYNADWGEYIDLETPVVVEHKEKLKAIITPLLTDNSISSGQSPSVNDEVSQKKYR